MRKRGDDFWGEFELYLSDLLVGFVLDFVLVALLAPTAVLGVSKASAGSSGNTLQQTHEDMPPFPWPLLPMTLWHVLACDTLDACLSAADPYRNASAF